MANYGIRYSVKLTDGMRKWAGDWTKSLSFICQPEQFVDIAKLYRYYINKFVPKKSGALRRSAKANGYANRGDGGGAFGASARIYWAPQGKVEKYAHYQFVGEVYGPNLPQFTLGPNKNGSAGVKHWGWRSPKGKSKIPMGRYMGEPTTYTLWGGQEVVVKGYTTPGTGYDWIERFKKDNSDCGEKAINIMAGRYTYELFCMCSKKTGHPVNPRGGFKVYYHVRGIKDETGG